jgi:hypothetical protein
MGNGAGDLAFWLAVGGAALALLFGPIGQAVGRLIESVGARREPATAELDQPLEEVAMLSHRVGELEERLDFADRLLSQHPPRQLTEADTPPEALPSAH